MADLVVTRESQSEAGSLCYLKPIRGWKPLLLYMRDGDAQLRVTGKLWSRGLGAADSSGFAELLPASEEINLLRFGERVFEPVIGHYSPHIVRLHFRSAMDIGPARAKVSRGRELDGCARTVDFEDLLDGPFAKTALAGYHSPSIVLKASSHDFAGAGGLTVL